MILHCRCCQFAVVCTPAVKPPLLSVQAAELGISLLGLCWVFHRRDCALQHLVLVHRAPA